MEEKMSEHVTEPEGKAVEQDKELYRAPFFFFYNHYR